MALVVARSSRSKTVIRKPLRTKKRSTPSEPSLGQPNAWSATTGAIATARTPSSAGRYPSLTALSDETPASPTAVRSNAYFSWKTLTGGG
jgi:hypothetical protein